MSRLLIDLTPLREIPAYRRLWAAISISNLGQQMSSIAVGYQVYELTKSSWNVGLVGLFQLVPLLLLGLWGGALSDVFDRRLVGLWAAIGALLCTVLLAVQALLGNTQVWILYVLIAAQAAVFAIGGPARQSIIPRIVPAHMLPAANALSMLSWNVGFTVGPLVGGAVIAVSGSVTTAYVVDGLLFLGMVYAMYRLPSLPAVVSGRTAGFEAIAEGLRFLKGKRNLQMSFYVDIIAMVFGMPRALFPALAATQYGNGMDPATMLGLLSAGPALGAAVSSVFSGPLGRIHRHGVAIVQSIIVWGLAIALFGLTSNIWWAVFFLAVAGAADNVSAVFRSTMLQSAVPDEYRGRLQGVFTVVVAGGPRLGDMEAGAAAAWRGEVFSVVSGGLACVALTIALVAAVPSFLKYDARNPRP